MLLVSPHESLVGLSLKFLRRVVEKLLRPCLLEEVSHARVLQSAEIDLFVCIHEASRHCRERLVAGRLDRFASSNRLLSEIVVEPERGPHRLAYRQVHLLVKLKLRCQIRLERSLEKPALTPSIIVLRLGQYEGLDGGSRSSSVLKRLWSVS